MVMVEHLVAVGRDVVFRERTPPEGTSTAKSTIISVVICALFFLVGLCGYINRYCRRVDGHEDTAAAAPVGGRSSSSGRSSRKRGLEQSVVATFPVMPWRGHHKEKEKTMMEEEEERCPVCLAAFEEGDNLRLLPHCSHVFHPECIDPWLQARATCPLCRANLELPLPADAVAIAMPAERSGDDDDDVDGGKEEEEAMELEMLRTERRAARLPPVARGKLALPTPPVARIAERVSRETMDMQPSSVAVGVVGPS
ncbi:hypothetical protein ACQJBY_040033 [Aegilops geniculata]